MHGNFRTLIAALIVGCPVWSCADTGSRDEQFAARIERILAMTPLIDAHNDLPWEIRVRFKNHLDAFDLQSDLSTSPLPPGVSLDNADTTGVPFQTDIPRLRAGHVGAQFWSIYVSPDIKGANAVSIGIEQMDLVKRLADRYPKDLEMAYSVSDIRRVYGAGRIACLMGIEGGMQMNDSLATLRQLYQIGARYMTLAHFYNTNWADSATDRPEHHGLAAFGKEVVREMNRLGMMIDISHVSAETMRDVLALSEAPVIFSHSSARALVDHPRNVPDDVLRIVAEKGGVVMVNFYPGYVSEARRVWGAHRGAQQTLFGAAPPFGGLYVGQPEKAKQAVAEWERGNPKPVATVAQVADHIEHIRKVAGVDHVGFGSDFDGMEETPVGLESVARYPGLLAELMRRGWSDEDIAKVAGGNLLRVMGSVESVGAKLQRVRQPSNAFFDAPARP